MFILFVCLFVCFSYIFVIYVAALLAYKTTCTITEISQIWTGAFLCRFFLFLPSGVCTRLKRDGDVDAENSRLEKARLENAVPNCRVGKRD